MKWRCHALRILACASVVIATSGQAGLLHNAVDEGDIERVESLITQGTDIDAPDDAGRTALHWAAGEGHTQIAARLIAAGAEVNAKSKGGWTPLHTAAQEGQTAATQLLIAKGGALTRRTRTI